MPPSVLIAPVTSQSSITVIDNLASAQLYQPQRLYLTGDLVKYHPNGELEYLSRKDSQVKLHSQRLKLGEIKYNIIQSLHARLHGPQPHSPSPIYAVYYLYETEQEGAPCSCIWSLYR